MKNLIIAKVQSFTKDKLPQWVIDRVQADIEKEIEQQVAKLIEKKVTPRYIADLQFAEWSKNESSEPPAPSPATPEPKKSAGKSSH